MAWFKDALGDSWTGGHDQFGAGVGPDGGFETTAAGETRKVDDFAFLIAVRDTDRAGSCPWEVGDHGKVGIRSLGLWRGKESMLVDGRGIERKGGCSDAGR